jgi:chaperonin cofactor prefoldin
MGFKQYDEEYVTSLEAEVRALQKQRHELETRLQDLMAELEQVVASKRALSAHG